MSLEHENARLAQLEWEDNMVMNTMAKLVAEMAEIRRGRGEQSGSKDKSMTQSVPTEVPMAGNCDAERPTKKRAISGEQEKPASRAVGDCRDALFYEQHHEAAERDCLAPPGQYASHGREVQSEVLQNIIVPRECGSNNIGPAGAVAPGNGLGQSER